MSLLEVLPAIRSLSRADRVRLVHFLVEDLASDGPELSHVVEGLHPVWIPEDNSEGAAVLQRLLDDDRARR